MAIKKEYTMMINKKSSVLNENLTISTNDVGLDIIFRLVDCPYINLSLQKNLYARVILKDPLGKQIDSDITSIVENRVLFRLDKNLMSRVTETGIYKLYIAIMDEKNNINLLPPIACTISESDVEVKGLSTGLINQSGIDNSLTTDYGSEIALFNADGTYNRTVWISGDMITTARMNKIEDGISNARDHILDINDKIEELDENMAHKSLVGLESIPIIIADLPKGFYIIRGYTMDFTNKAPYKLEGENYFMVTYSGETYSKIQRCLSTEEKFVRYKYDKVLETIYKNEQELVACRQENGYISVSLDSYQSITLAEDSEVILPEPGSFVEVKLYVKSTTSAVLTFNNVTWLKEPAMKLGEMNIIYLTYIDGTWYGNAV